MEKGIRKVTNDEAKELAATTTGIVCEGCSLTDNNLSEAIKALIKGTSNQIKKKSQLVKFYPKMTKNTIFVAAGVEKLPE